MESWKIYQVYKFKNEEEEFIISEGEKLKVRLKSGEAYDGVLVAVSSIADCFDIDTTNGVVTIDCEDIDQIISDKMLQERMKEVIPKFNKK